MNKPIVAATCFLISVAAGSAFAGKPAWCKTAGSSDTYDLKDLSDKDSSKVVITFVKATCSPTDEADAHHDDIEKARQQWSKRLDMVEGDWADAVEYAALDYGRRMNAHVQIRESQYKGAWSTYDAIDQWAMITQPFGASGALVLDSNYLADALGTRLTEVGRAAYVRKCVLADEPVQWAMCQGDIAQLDYAKIATELRATTSYHGLERMLIRLSVDALRKEYLPEHATKVKALLAKDPGYQRLFDASAATWKEWAGRYKTDAAVLDVVNAMDDARATNSRSAWVGCEDKTWAAWKALLATVPAKDFDGVFRDSSVAMGPILSHPSLYLASVAMVTCMTVGQDHDHHADILIRSLGSGMERWPGFRGPRNATESALLTAGIKLDDRDAELEFPHVDRPFFSGSGSSGGGSGVVGSLKPSGKTVVVTFKKQLVKQVQCAEARATNHVTQIRPDGSLIYQTNCIRNETVTVDKASGPQTVNARYAAGVKPGMYVSIVEDVIEAARDKPGASIPAMVFGVEVK